MLFRNTEIDGLNIFYREAGDRAAPKITEKFHVIAPDYPGFGNSDMPDPWPSKSGAITRHPRFASRRPARAQDPPFPVMP